MSITTSQSPSLLADDDELASQTSTQLSITHTALPIPHTSHKRTHPNSSQTIAIPPDTPSPIYIQFNTPLHSTPDELFNQLTSTLTKASIPLGSISSTISFWAFSSIKVSD
jgi:hypothetical protein